MQIGNNLKLLRKRKKQSQEEVAQALSLTRSTYSGYENGVAQPNLENLISFSDFYKVPIDDLVRKNFETFSEQEWEKIDKGLRIFSRSRNRKNRLGLAQNFLEA